MPKATVTTSTTSTTPSPLSTEAERSVTTLFQNMKDLMGPILESMNASKERTVETIKVGRPGGEAQITHLRKNMDEQEKRQQAQIAEIQHLFKEVLDQDVKEHLTALIESDISRDIDSLVAAEVEKELPHYIPQDLLDELKDHKKELEKMEKELHNSESRRANSTLRSHRLHEAVHTLYNTHGEISAEFPATLQEMFAIPDEKIVTLLRDYDLDEPAQSREKNVNTFMQHCGVQYQLITTGLGAPVPCRTTLTVNGDSRRG